MPGEPSGSNVRDVNAKAAVVLLVLAVTGGGSALAGSPRAIIPAANWTAAPVSQPGTEIMRFTLSKKRRLTAVSLDIAMQCPYHGNLWPALSRNAEATHLRVALDSKNRFRVTLRFTLTSPDLSLNGIDIKYSATATIDGRLSSARKARGTMRFSSTTCVVGDVYGHWTATGYGAPH